MRHAIDVIDRQLKLNQEKNLLFSGAPGILEIEPVFLAAIEEIIATDQSEWRDDVEILAAITAEAFIDMVYSVNQYVQVGRKEKDELKAIYLNTWSRFLDDRDIELTLRRYHYPQIIKWIKGLYPEALSNALSSQKIISRVTCREYSAEFQISLYGLDYRKMQQPVLDLGCGSNALLATYLRNNNVEIYGVDRILNVRKPYLKERDWLAVDVAENSWGTIISNMAFTNHYEYVQRYNVAQKPKYQQQYRNLLESLKTMGAFHYGPSVPELERGVDKKRFKIEVNPVNRTYGITKITKIAS